MDESLKNNLLLQEGDHVVIHNIWEYKFKYMVSIKGMVHKPGQYRFAENMTIRDLIVVGGNIKDNAYLQTGELVRYEIVDGKKVVDSLISFNVGLALKKEPNHNLPLKPMDVVHIKQIPGWQEKHKTVTISGQVQFPGTYEILRHERLSDVLTRAGGFTRESYLRGAYFTRTSVKNKQKKELAELIQSLEIEMASLSAGENGAMFSDEAIRNRAYLMAAQNTLVQKLKQKKPSGRVILSLLPLDKIAMGTNDILLEDKDSLFIPGNPNTIHVIGAVYQPVTAVYNEKETQVSYYLDMSGGPTANAQTDEIYIVRADGRIVSRSSSPKKFGEISLYSGDTIVVPHKGIRPEYFYMLSERNHSSK